MFSISHFLKKRASRIQARSRESKYGILQQFTSAILIFLLFLSQTVHIDFLDPVGATDNNRYDIVSIFVDSDTYTSLKSKIQRYANDIQGYLGQTRVHIIITDSKTRPENIAAQNERLYYEGDKKDGISRLVGTILIGNVPLPIVEKGGRTFPSLYPYVDFEDKRFVFDHISGRYIFSEEARQSTDVEIWHGVIRPSLGKPWNPLTDREKISNFLDKTHNFYTRSGKFAPSSLPPRVFYYDGYTENRSVSKKNFYKYLLFIQNVENIAYKRFTKYLLSDVQNAIRQFQQANIGEEDEYFQSIVGMSGTVLGDDTLSDENIRILPDIQTVRPIMAYLKRFHEIINEKTLGDIQKFVYNAGRYNSGITVRVDQSALDITTIDEVAMHTLKEANDNLESSIDSVLRSNNYARKIILFDGIERHIVSSKGTILNQAGSTISSIISLLNITGSNPEESADSIIDDIISGVLNTNPNIGMATPPTPPPNTIYTKIFLGYLFGQKIGHIQSPHQCTLARGNIGQKPEFGKPLLAEANSAYDLTVVESHISTLSGDTNDLLRAYRNASYSCFPSSGNIRTKSYWGGNSPLALIGSGAELARTLYINPPNTQSLTGFSLPIFSFGGLKETERFSPPSLSDCDTKNPYQYGLLQPYTYPVVVEGVNSDIVEMRQWPPELGRFTCLTNHEFLQRIPSFAESITDYRDSTSCLYGSLILDGQYFDNNGLVSTEKTLGTQCKQWVGGEGGDEIDNTNYENRYYHTIDSLMKHVSPTDEEIRSAEKNGSTPSLPVDMVRFVEFLTPNGNIAKLTYPNFFQAEGNTVEDIRRWLKDLSEKEWNAIITKENTTSLTPIEQEVKNLLKPGNLPPAPIDWNTLISDDTIEKILEAKRALILSPGKKHKIGIESLLSYSHDHTEHRLPDIPRSRNGYEIAYLGLTPFDPSGKDIGDDEELSQYNALLSELSAVNFSEEEPGDENPHNKPSSQCGPPDGVNIFKWPQAIICWLKSMMPPKISAGSCGPATVGLDSQGGLKISFATGGLQGPFFPWDNLPKPSIGTGSLSRLSFEPLSTIITRSSESAGMLSLLDEGGNPISASLNTITANIQGGVFIYNGEEKDTITLDTLESDIVFRYRPTSGDTLTLTFSYNGGNSITKTIRVVDSAPIRLSRSADPIVGGSGITLTLEITDTAGNTLSGLQSVVSLSLPYGAGRLSRDIVEIRDGKSETILFTPGRIAGNHTLTVEVPGIGSLDIPFSVNPGIPLYIDGRILDMTIEFALRDRYGNISPVSLPGTLRVGNASPTNVSFSSGVLSIPRQSGFIRINVPSIAQNSIRYSDIRYEQTSTGIITIPGTTKTLQGIPFFVLYVPEASGKYDFLPDYNARYTILAGDSYLEEASDILYNTDPNNSQSLAVTTSTFSPYLQDYLFTIFPGGGYSLGQESDIHIETRASILTGDILLTAYDSVSRTKVADVRYPLKNLSHRHCLADSLEDKKCYSSYSSGVLTLITPKNSSDLSVSSTQNNITLKKSHISLLEYNRSSGLVLASGVRITPIDRLSLGSLVLSIEYNGSETARIIISIPQGEPITVSSIYSQSSGIILGNNHMYSRVESYSHSWDTQSRGYSIFRSSDKKILDENLLGPSHIDSLSALSEIPGVGWHGKNRLLLSYAGGDTVGQASRFYHDYIGINLGDPVAHVDTDAPGVRKEGIDRTLGTLISSGNGRNIQSYKTKDMDADNDQDILIIYDDGFIDLFLNVRGKFQRRQIIAHLPDFVRGQIEFGDFTGDGYADILGINASGSLSLVDNSERRFLRTPLSLSSSGSIPTKISQYKVYDMDADSKDDIVYLTEGGELGILYGTSTRGIFEKKVLETTLGVRLPQDSVLVGGAIQASSTPSTLPTSTDTGSTDSALLSEVFYERSRSSSQIDESIEDAQNIDTLFAQNLNPNPTNTQQRDLYVRSEYATAYGLDIRKSYEDLSSGYLEGGDRVRISLSIKNTTSSSVRNIIYLDTLEKVFELDDNAKYTLTLSGQTQEKKIIPLSAEEYDIEMTGIDIPPGSTLLISYEVRALPASYGTMIVDNLEKGTVGDDKYGDIGFETSEVCGDDFIIWKSEDVRSYTRSTRSFSPPELPPSLMNQLRDANRNGVPDSIENMSTGSLQDSYNKIPDPKSLISKPIFSLTYDSNRRFTLGFSDSAEKDIESSIQNIMNGLSCGFGGGSCIAFPINDAPLAPGASPSILGFPLLPQNLMVPNVSGFPIFAAPTICITPFGPIPGTWPPCPLGAGGIIQPPNISQFRLFITPTLTLGVGAAMCMGPNMAGTNPLDPFIPLGNCIVAAKPLPLCKGDGSSDDGNIVGVSGLGTSTDAWNSVSCTLQLPSQQDIRTAREDIISYLRNPSSSSLLRANTSLLNRGGRSSHLGGPLIRIGNDSTSGTEFTLNIDSAKPLTPSNIIKVRNRRIRGFPEFLMDWVARQTDEITNKLLTLPNLVIVLPRNFSQNGVIDKSFSDFLQRFSTTNISSGFDDLKTKMGNAYTARLNAEKNTALAQARNTNTHSSYSLLSEGKSTLAGAKQKLDSTLAYGKAGASSIKAAYQFISTIPFLTIEEEAVPINIPWILPNELDKYARAIDAYKSEIERAKTSWCVGKTPSECASLHTRLGTSAFISSLEQNLRRIEEYKKFPEKIQKYLTWKQRYIAQLLCNVEALEKMIGGWYRDNGIRFRKWAEFYVLMKAIVSSWQPLIDIFRIKEEECSVCRNERWDLKTFTFRLISAIIPQLPIIQFPRWPDIVLDLSDIRFGIIVKVPDFRFNISPIRLPNLPSLSLPNLPNVNITLPSLPTLPEIPPLPDLPDLPSLPNISLPSLPPPPKIPKIFGAVSAFLKIGKLVMKLYCFYQKRALVPENRVGSVIAQRTDRQATLPFDFLSVKFPQIAIPTIREIRVSTHINFELRSEFIAEFAKNAVKPINSFTTDFSRAIPSNIGQDIRINTLENIDITPRSSIENDETMIAKLEDILTALLDEIQKDQNIMMDTDDFRTYFRSELLASGLDTESFDRMWNRVQREVDDIEQILEKNRNTYFKHIRDYLYASSAEIYEQEKLLKKLSEDTPLLSEMDLPRALFISGKKDLSQEAYDRYRSFRDREPLLSDISSEITPKREIVSLQGQMSRILANTQPSSQRNDNIANGYTPIYRGHFILSPITQSQTRLFDYTDLIDESDRVQVIDIDKDSDNDYIYLLGGSLYIKYTQLSPRNRNSGNTQLQIYDIDNTIIPDAPNYFHEIEGSPGALEISFAGAQPTDSIFRLEFFDRYIEWDKVRENDDRDYPDTPRTLVDMSLVRPMVHNGNIQKTKISHILSRIEGDANNIILEGMRSQVIERNTSFSLTAGRPLYIGNTEPTLSYTTSTGALVSIPLEKFHKYVFSETIVGTLQGGKGYILTPSRGERLSYNDDMRGMPLLPDTRIISSDAKIEIYLPDIRETYTILPNTEFRHISLGTLSQKYNPVIDYPNGFYSARLRSLSSSSTTRAGVTLIAPQASLDTSPPIIDIAGRERIPVYQTSTKNLSEIISEMSNYSVSIDPDTTIDQNNDGDFMNDFSQSGSGVSITSQSIQFGPFDTLGTRNMSIRVTDEHGNSTITPFKIEVYAPIPQITGASLTGYIRGILDEPISQEPIDIFRIRQGHDISRLFRDSLMTNTDGVFFTGSIPVLSGVLLSYPGGSTRISETSGLPDSLTGVIFSPATSTGSMTLDIVKSNTIVLRQFLLPPDTLILTNSGSIPGLSIPSILLEQPSKDTSELVRAPFNDPNNPSGYYLLDKNKKALVALDRRGQIYALDKDITFSPNIHSGYLQIHIKKGETLLLKVTYKINFFYTVNR